MNDLEKKCLGCIYGVKVGLLVKCTCHLHPGVVGRTGTEWVQYCCSYRIDLDKKDEGGVGADHKFYSG